jgi:Chaperone of endosialidase
MDAIIRASHPISFRLLNRDGHPVLGIFDGHKGQMSKLEITNGSRRDMKPKQPAAGEPAPENHHFELRFRPGTLSGGDAPQVTVDEGDGGWRISKPTETNGAVSLYLLSTKPVALESGETTSLTLRHLSADGSAGARGTRVELKWGQGNLEYVAGDAAQPAEPLAAGHRVQHLSIVNERGQKHIPLHVGIVGADKVLNDGKAVNTLKMRITNLLNPGQGSIQLNPKDDPEHPASEFVFSFDASDKEEWALATRSQVESIDIKGVAGATKFAVRKDKEGQTPVWIMTPPARVSLGPDEFVEVTLSNIISSLPSGQANVYVHYRNIPGYWDGDFVSHIEKGPVVYKGDRVGIGTSDPQAKLQIKGGDIRLDEGREIMFGDSGQIRSFDNNHRILFRRIEGKLELREYGSIIFSPGATAGNETAKVVMLANGNVGIGEPVPGKTLSVKGGLRVENEVSVGGGYVLEVDAPNVAGGRLKVNTNGNVGIGTNDPQAKLHVRGGDIRLDTNREVMFDDNGQIKSADNNHRILFRRSEDKLELREYGSIIFSPGATAGNETAKVVMLANGRVGIGAPDPRTTLHVNGGLRVENEVSVGGGYALEVDAPGVVGGRFKVATNGFVGIGTNDPKVGLEVRNWANHDLGGGFWFAFLGEQRRAAGGSHINSISIRAGLGIQSETGLYVTSDSRVKKDLRRSKPAADLETLSRLRVTDFRYVDVITHGDRQKKGFIAQQVEEVFPQAVEVQTDVVPDIYRQAPCAGGWVELANDLKAGERLRLISERGEGVHEVLEATPDGFRTDLVPEGDKVFVYGREVEDFRILDYDAIAVLNVSATQQLKKEKDEEVKALRAESAELRADNDALAGRLRLLESRLEAVLGAAGATNGSNGSGKR